VQADRGLLENYRRALSSVTADAARNVENLKLVGDEDGLFEVTRSLRLLEVLDLCERWSASGGPARRHSAARRRRAGARCASHSGTFKVEHRCAIARSGLVDISRVVAQ